MLRDPKSVKAPGGVISIGQRALCDGDNCKEKQHFPSLESVVIQAGWHHALVCLKRVETPAGCESIGRSAFGFCPSLGDAKIPAAASRSSAIPR